MANTLHILLLEDSTVDAELISHGLTRAGLEFEILRVENERDYLRALDEQWPDLVLADYTLPEYDGLSALQQLRQRHRDLPFIFVTGSMGEELAVDSLHQGADDFIIKDRLGRLPAALQRALGRYRQEQEIERANKARHASEQRYAAAVNNIQDAFMLVDEQALIVECNRSAARLFGYQPEDIPGRSINDFVAEPTAAGGSVATTNDSALKTGPSVKAGTRELLGIHRDGHRFPVELSVSSMQLEGRTTAIWLLRDISQRKQAELHLQQAALIIENSPAVMFRWRNEPGWPVEMVSENVSKLGYSANDMLNGVIRFADIVHADDLDRVRREVALYIEQGVLQFQQEYRIVSPDGKVHWVDDRTQMELDASGHVTHLQGIVVDITERKLAEQKARTGYEIQRALNDLLHLSLPSLTMNEVLNQALTIMMSAEFLQLNTRGAIFLADADVLHFKAGKRITQAQTEHCEVLEFGHGLAGIAAQTRTLQFAEANEQICAGDDTHHGSYAVPIMQDDVLQGVLMLCLMDGQARSAKLDEFLLMVSDTLGALISSKRTGEELGKLVAAVEQSPEAIVITDRELNIQYVNEAFVNSSGYTLEEALGRNPGFLRSEFTSEETYSELWQALDKGEPWKGEFHNRRKDGSVYIEFAHIAPIRQPNGEISHYVAVKEDITARKKLAQELDRHRHHLEDLVEERTRELNLAKNRSDSANKAKSTFLANMSHEIRTPMNAIIGLTHLMKESDLSPVQVERVGKISDAAAHLLSIINDILDISKIEAGKLDLEAYDFSLDGIFEHVLTLLREQAADKGIQIVTRSEGVPRWLRGDPTRLRQALLNYAANALKFTETGKIELAAVVENRQGSELTVRFDVLDTGIGIDAESLKGLFNAFEQADSSSTRKYGGTGLGLAITRHLAHLMGGEAGAESEPGKGSHFWFRVQLQEGNPDRAVDDDPDLSAILTQRLLPSTHLLLAEDNPINREVALEMLRGYGVQVDAAENGREAVSRARHMRYDLILMDLQMPEMSGLEATRLIRGMQPYAEVPILAMTANVFEEDRQASLEAGMNDFIVKPVNPKALFSVLVRWLPGKVEQTAPAIVSERDTVFKGQGADPERDLRQWLAGKRFMDSKSGLSKVRDDVDHYLRLLSQFDHLHGGDRQRLRLDIHSGLFDSARALAHSIMGSAATLGLNEISDRAEKLESCLRVQHDLNRKVVISVLDQLGEAFEHLEGLLREVEKDKPGNLPEKHIDVREVLQQIERLLAQDDAGANELFSKSEGALNLACGKQVKTLGRLIDGFEYPSALSLVKELLETLDAERG
jgi:two-component system sensor histidine kinase/response regulator